MTDLATFLKDLPVGPGGLPKLTKKEAKTVGREGKNVAENLYENIRSLPGDIYSAVRHPEAALAGAGYAVGEVPYNIGRMLTEAVNKLPFERQLPMPDDPFQVLKRGGQAISPAAFGGGRDIALLAAPEVGPEATTIPRAIARQATTAGAYTGLTGGTPTQVAESIPFGAAIGVIPQSSRIVDSLIGKLSKKGAGKLSQEALEQRIASIPEGTRPSIGDVTGNKSAQFIYHNILGAIPFSGIPEKTSNFVNAVKGKAGSMANNLLGGSSEESLPSDIASSVKDAEKRVRAQTRRNYKYRDKLANDAGVTFEELPNVTKFAKDKIDEISEKPEQFLTTIDDATVKDLGKIAKKDFIPAKVAGDDSELVLPADMQKQVKSKSAKRDYSIQNVHRFRSDLLKKAAALEENGDKTNASIYSSLAENLDKDIDKNVSDKGGEELKNAHADAQKYFKENRLPFIKNKSVRNILKDKYNEKTIHEALLKLENKGVLKNLSQSDKNKILYSKLKGALRPNEVGALESNPYPLFNKYNQLEDAQKARLVTPEIDDEFKKLASLGKIAEEPMKQEANAYTGGRTFKNLLGGGFYAELARKALSGDLPGAVTDAVLAPAAARLLGNKLDSPELINVLSKTQAQLPMQLDEPGLREGLSKSPRDALSYLLGEGPKAALSIASKVPTRLMGPTISRPIDLMPFLNLPQDDNK